MKRVTIQDIADELGISRNTVSKAINNADGLAEATSAEGELFGTDRILASADESSDISPKEVLENITEAVDDFVGDNEQFDDLTMLCVEYKGC